MITWGNPAGVVAALVLVTGLVGCSGGSASTPRTSTVTVTSSATAPSPSVSPLPTLPAAARQSTTAGAQAFSRHFFAVYNYAFWAADPAPLQAISDPRCVFCKSSIDAVRAIRDHRDHAVGGDIDVLVAAAAPGQPENRVVVNLLLHQQSGRTLSTGGQIVGTTPERKDGRVDLVVGWSGNGWIVLEADIKRNGES